MADAVADAVEAKIGSSWTSADGNVLPVRLLNEQGDPPADGSPFIVIEYPVRNETQQSLGSPGSNYFKEEGVFRIVVNERRTFGTTRVRSWVDELRTLFRGQNLSTTVQCFEASGPAITEANDLGNYWQMSFVVRYWAYATG